MNDNLTLDEYFGLVQNKIRNGEFEILKITTLPDNEIFVYLEAVNYMIYEYSLSKNDNRQFFPYILIPNDLSWTFKSISFEEFILFLSRNKSKTIEKITININQKNTIENVYTDYFGIEWYKQLKNILHSDYFTDLRKFLKRERKNKMMYPENMKLAFRAFRETPYSQVKVVILGQDIYHDGSFDGLAFSNGNKKGSPSLRNIMKEVKRSYPENNINSDLTDWAKQGVLLINVGMTVIKGNPGSHLEKWKPFTKHVFYALNKKSNIIYLLWGKFAQSYKQYIDVNNNIVLEAGHPSPLNRTNPFIGCNHFVKVNEFLNKKIIW